MSPELYEFGDVTVDLRRMQVRRAGRVVALEPKSFDVLRLLIENRDRLVTKDELLDVVWEGAHGQQPVDQQVARVRIEHPRRLPDSVRPEVLVQLGRISLHRPP